LKLHCREIKSRPTGIRSRKTRLLPGSCVPDPEHRGVYITMEVDLIFKIAAVGILVAVLNILLSRSGRDEQALMVTIAGLVCVLVIVVREISDLFRLIQQLFGL